MSALLWTLLVIGVWNFVALLGRVAVGDFKTWHYTYAWEIILGAWALVLLAR